VNLLLHVRFGNFKVMAKLDELIAVGFVNGERTGTLCHFID
jgi:hypothetical protein